VGDVYNMSQITSRVAMSTSTNLNHTSHCSMVAAPISSVALSHCERQTEVDGSMCSLRFKRKFLAM
jgi:hypothetical protein